MPPLFNAAIRAGLSIRQPSPDIIGTECSICQEPYTGGRIAEIRACKHYYHLDCLHEWVMGQEQDTCPYCRTRIDTQTSPPDVSLSRQNENGEQNEDTEDPHINLWEAELSALALRRDFERAFPEIDRRIRQIDNEHENDNGSNDDEGEGEARGGQ